METPPPQIVGIMLVRNEDRFVEAALRNALDFCDRLIVADHRSTDGTTPILRRLAAAHPKIEYHLIAHTRESHALVAPLAGTRTWVFGVDGDEIYDPAGLREMRRRLLAGQYADAWVIFGNVLNVTQLDPARHAATGHLAPPCRSMTKLYNFHALVSWTGCPQVFAGGTLVFKPGHGADQRLNLYQQCTWEEAVFRCLHVCFLRRSSLEPEGETVRLNVSERRNQGPRTRLVNTLRRWLGRPPRSTWKMEKYGRGEAVTKDIAGFNLADAAGSP